MNEYTLKIDFNNQRIFPNQEIELVQNDYNSTKFKFIFDNEYSNYTKVFELKYPSGKKWIKEIINDELILANYDEDGNIIPILVQSGEYEYEVVLYDEISKLTNFATGKFFVRPELVNPTDEEIELETEYPILDQLIQDTIELKNEVDNIDIDLEKKDNKTKITLTNKAGLEKTVEVLDGEKGEDYSITEKDYTEISDIVMSNIQMPTKTSDLVNDSNFATTDKNNNFSTSQTINGTLAVNGSIVQYGETYETHAEQVYTQKDEIITRTGAMSGLAENQYTGILAKMYDGTNDGRLGFNADGEAKVGDIGDEQPLLTRDEIINLREGQVLVWDGTRLRAVGSSDFVKNTDYPTSSKSGVVKLSSPYGLTANETGRAAIVKALEKDIDDRNNMYNPIVPYNLVYAVGSVKANEVQSGTARMWLSTNENGEIGLNISTE